MACSPAETVGPAEGVPPAPPPPPGAGLTYQFGAKFEPPAGRVIHGLGQWEPYNTTYAAMLPANTQPASELLFIDIGDTPRGWEPGKIAAKLGEIAARGRIPLIDIAPRGLQIPQAELDTMADPLFGIDHVIAAGPSKYDARIDDLAQILAAFKKPVMVRIGGEFNGPWNGYHPWAFPRAFRKIAQRIKAAGAANAAFVWCYEPAAAGDFDEKNAQGEWKWFPGDDVIDWFSIDVYAKQDLSGPLTSHGGMSSYAKTLKFLDMAVSHGRPVVIAESGPAHYDLTQQTSAEAAWQEWLLPYFALIATRSEIKWFTYVTYDWPKASYYAAIGWKNGDIAASPWLVPLYAAELAKPKYLHAGELGLLKDYSLYH